MTEIGVRKIHVKHHEIKLFTLKIILPQHCIVALLCKQSNQFPLHLVILHNLLQRISLEPKHTNSKEIQIFLPSLSPSSTSLYPPRLHFCLQHQCISPFISSTSNLCTRIIFFSKNYSYNFEKHQSYSLIKACPCRVRGSHST